MRPPTTDLVTETAKLLEADGWDVRVQPNGRGVPHAWALRDKREVHLTSPTTGRVHVATYIRYGGDDRPVQVDTSDYRTARGAARKAATVLSIESTGGAS